MKPKRSYPKASGTYDECGTPDYAIEAITPYLPPRLWETAPGEELMVRALRRRGFDVVYGPWDFFKVTGLMPDVDCLITNPPYSIKYEWIRHTLSFGKPAALLLPLESLGAMAFWNAANQRVPSILIVTPRINFKMPNKGWNTGGAQFPIAWFCWGLDMPPISHVNIIDRRNE